MSNEKLPKMSKNPSGKAWGLRGIEAPPADEQTSEDSTLEEVSPLPGTVKLLQEPLFSGRVELQAVVEVVSSSSFNSPS